MTSSPAALSRVAGKGGVLAGLTFFAVRLADPRLDVGERVAATVTDPRPNQIALIA